MTGRIIRASTVIRGSCPSGPLSPEGPARQVRSVSAAGLVGNREELAHEGKSLRFSTPSAGNRFSSPLSNSHLSRDAETTQRALPVVEGFSPGTKDNGPRSARRGGIASVRIEACH